MKRVVVTGMGVVSPVGNTLETFWQSLSRGQSGIGLITRFDTAQQKVKVAAQVTGFDPAAYLEKGEVRKTDLFAQYAMGAAVQAMEDSALAGRVEPTRLGVYLGSGTGGLDTVVRQVDQFREKGPRHVSPFLVPMMICNIAAGIVAIRYNAQGPSLPIVTACATSTNTIGEAYRAIRHGYADAILAGGAEAAINEVAVAGFANCKALTTAQDPQNACMPFDQRRSGFVMGEGAGVLVLEEYQHAKARGAKIYGEVVGYGNTCDAHHITAPHPEAQGASRAIRQAVEELLQNRPGWTLDRLPLYINAHGTSTPLNDRAETLAIKQALGEENARRAAISSTKSMTGHMLGAAGAVEAIASLLALQNSLIPPTIGYRQPDPDCDLDYTPNTPRHTRVDAALSTSLGFGGHNGCVAFARLGEGE